MDLNAGIHYPPLQSNSETRVLLLAPGEDDEPVHCFHLVIDLDADWEAPGVAVHLRPTPGERKLSHIEVKSHGGEVFQSFTVTTTRLENSSSLHPFQRYMALSYVWGDQGTLHTSTSIGSLSL